MHKQEQTKRLKPHRIWIIDVDQTTTQKHTYHLDRQNQKLESKAERQDGRSMEDEKIYANLRNPGWLRSFIEERHKEGELVLFLTFHPNLPHVAAYLSVLFNEKELRKIADEDKNIFREKGVDSEDVIFSYYLTLNQPFIGIFSCQADTTGEGKNLAIDKVFKLLKEKFSIVTPYEKNIFLIDDDEFNYWAAIRKGIRAVLANPAND